MRGGPLRVQGMRHPCPAGRFGASSGLDNARCSGALRAGLLLSRRVLLEERARLRWAGGLLPRRES